MSCPALYFHRSLPDDILGKGVAGGGGGVVGGGVVGGGVVGGSVAAGGAVGGGGVVVVIFTDGSFPTTSLILTEGWTGMVFSPISPVSYTTRATTPIIYRRMKIVGGSRRGISLPL
jgi:hypothetical protein